MTITIDADPACPPGERAPAGPPSGDRILRATREPFPSIDPAIWDRLAAANPWATPFSRWPFQRAWWDAYGETAHDETLVIRASESNGPEGGTIVGIVPLMHRHFSEPDDAVTATELRHGHEPGLTAVHPTAKVTFFGASYHADYATLLCAPEDLDGVAEAVAAALADPSGDPGHPEPWDAVDLRRLRCADPAIDALAAAFGRREIAEGWTVSIEREDVCPVVRLAEGIDLDGYLAGLDKKARHEIRRKVRRAEATGDVRFVDSPDPATDLPAFIALHQKRWGHHGLFPDTTGGERSRVFFRRLVEEYGGARELRLSFLWMGDRRVGAALWFCEGDTAYYYNAGLDPDARELSPGVVMVERSIVRAIEEETRRVDFLRGDEPYKYEWGAVDEPIVRVLVRRSGV